MLSILMWIGIGILFCIGVFTLIAGGMVLKKAGENPWKILIPVYGMYLVYKIADADAVYWSILIISAVTGILSGFIGSVGSPLIVMIISAFGAVITAILQIEFVRNLAAYFGKSGGFAAGLFFLYPVFLMILAFGSAVYRKDQARTSGAESWKCAGCGCEVPVSRGTCPQCGAEKDPYTDIMEKVSRFFGVPVSRLAGRQPSGLSDAEQRIMESYRTVSPDTQKAVRKVLEMPEES